MALSVEVWEMAKATGDLSHISRNPRSRLSNIYNKILRLNSYLSRWHETKIANPVQGQSALEQHYRTWCNSIGDEVKREIKQFLEQIGKADKIQGFLSYKFPVGGLNQQVVI